MFGGFLGCKKRSESVFSTTQAGDFPQKDTRVAKALRLSCQLLYTILYTPKKNKHMKFQGERRFACQRFRLIRKLPDENSTPSFWPSKVEKNQGWRNASFRIEKPWQMRNSQNVHKNVRVRSNHIFRVQNPPDLNKKETFLGRFLSMEISWHSDIILISSDSPSPFWQKIQDSRSVSRWYLRISSPGRCDIAAQVDTTELGSGFLARCVFSKEIPCWESRVSYSTLLMKKIKLEIVKRKTMG